MSVSLQEYLSGYLSTPRVEQDTYDLHLLSYPRLPLIEALRANNDVQSVRELRSRYNEERGWSGNFEGFLIESGHFRERAQSSNTVRELSREARDCLLETEKQVLSAMLDAAQFELSRAKQVIAVVLSCYSRQRRFQRLVENSLVIEHGLPFDIPVTVKQGVVKIHRPSSPKLVRASLLTW
jgi:hypothetical protein